jgi:YesN/AraC family two-component response regulator
MKTCIDIHARLALHMDTHRPFLQPRYTIQALARELNTPSYQLSEFFNKEMGCNFNNYINRLRVRYCQELICQGTVDRLNLYGLAFQCGFHNRNSFREAFKKFAGCTPSLYLRRLQPLHRHQLQHLRSSKLPRTPAPPRL